MSVSSDYSDSECGDSDRELQEAFKQGLIKPGLNVPVEEELKKECVNNVTRLKQCLENVKKNLDWVERLDLTTGLAPTAPEIALRLAEIEEDSQAGKLKLKKTLDPTVDDFKREMNFHRQAQAAVLEAIPRLHKLGVQTKRPDDYFAEMTKSDTHMQKIRNSLLKTKAGLEVSEKVKKLRQNQKLMKQRQAQSLLNRQKEKREFNEQVKKYRKGMRDDLDFLEPENKKKAGPRPGPKNTGPSKKRLKKNEKFGAGGKKRGLKTNSSTSYADFDKKTPKRQPKQNFGGRASNAQVQKKQTNKNKPNRRKGRR